MFVFRGTVEECHEMYHRLYKEAAVVTGSEEELEERGAKLIIMDAREDFQNN